MKHLPILTLLFAAAMTFGCDVAPPPSDDRIAATVRGLRIPEQFAAGEALFDANCASCHGSRALGTDVGPPLVHIVYEPSHHGDVAFVMAVERGVRAHHWGFGDMPPIPGITRDQIQLVTAYIRFLQRQVGIG